MISDDLRDDAWANDGPLPLVLLIIDHATLPEPIRLVNNKQDIQSNGEDYIGFPFDIVLPDSKDSAPPTAKIRIDNVSREIGQAIRSISTPPTVTIRVVRQETPNIIEAEFSGMYLTNVTYDVMSVDADLQFEDLMREPYPYIAFSPSMFKGIL